jgi:hypothetical protein
MRSCNQIRPFWNYPNFIILSRDRVTVDEVCVGNRIYSYSCGFQLQVTIALSLIQTLCSSLLHILSFLSLLCLQRLLPGNGFQFRSSSASDFTSILAGGCLTTNSMVLSNGLQQWGLPRLHQGRPSATTSDGSVSQPLTADSSLCRLTLLTGFKSKSR